MYKKHPDWPEHYFPLRPITNYWNLGGSFGADAIEIRRRGYGLVPNFSTTIDGATGRTIPKGIGDLGHWQDLATPTRAMKGYIALSRVKKADDFLLAQAFSPCLFTQGKQHWPSLLLDVQTGAIPVTDTFQQLCTDTERLSKNSKKLLDAEFWCSGCKQHHHIDHFVKKNNDTCKWYEDVQRLVLEPGSEQRVCGDMTCRRYICSDCHVQKPRSDFTVSMWSNKSHSDRRIICKECQQKQKALTHKCDVCQAVKMRNDFLDSMWHNKEDPDRRTLCKECCHPQCTSRHCKTCRSCRNPACKKTTKRSHCTDEIKALNAKQLPKTLDEVQRFLCAKCQFITCTRIDAQGNRCGKEMAKKAQARLSQSPSKEYICGTCQTLDAAKASLQTSKR